MRIEKLLRSTSDVLISAGSPRITSLSTAINCRLGIAMVCLVHLDQMSDVERLVDDGA